MKRIRYLCIAFSTILIILSGCSVGATEGPTEMPPEQELEPEQKVTTTTLMIYMVGSDLEPKSGAASSDLEEIVQSGIDLNNNKVVVCAGGSPYWHNEQVDKEHINILQMQDGDFVSVSTLDSASMGTAEQLSSFLNYCWENYPSDKFALILWDHGNGPVMGYGKDILYDNDALLLEEMAQAMQNSAFSSENKLSWMGFDACLMASAELSCLMADYADYLIASQEVEPAFGWDYGFLAQLGKVDTPQLLKKITEDYMAACVAYYAGRNYDFYDVTLSVVDLSCAVELESAINALFSVAAEEVSHYYDLLAMNRVQSRALGRATTGSEYDLVDLQDMAVRLSAQYPVQAKALMDVIERMVVVNANSTGTCCGMSLYYPFYNKYYYEKDWKNVYSELGVFSEYQEYLTEYEQTWLKEDKLEMMTLGAVPEQTAEKTYSITLDENQAKSFGSAVYHILKRETEDLYRKVFSSQDVTWENNTLTAEYDGMAIYVRTSGGETFIPPLSAVDNIGRLYRYSGVFQLSNLTFKPAGLKDEELPEDIISNWRYLLTLNSETGKADMSGTVPLMETSAQDLVESGRIAEADLSLYGAILFYHSEQCYMTRYDNGIIKPLNQWYRTGVSEAAYVPLAEGYTFEYAPLAGGQYYLMFEITDTQSGKYCSELLPISVEDMPQQETPLMVTESVWEQNEERVLLKEQDGIEIYLTTKDTEYDGTRYFLEAENANDFAIKININETVANGGLITRNTNYFRVKAYDFMYDDLRFGISEGTGDLDSLDTLQFAVTVKNERTGAIIWPEQLLKVDMTAAPTSEFLPSYQHCMEYDMAYLGAKAEKQVIYESDSLRLTLMGIGEASQCPYSEGKLWVYAENLTEQELNVGIYGLVLNGYFIRTNVESTLPAGMQNYLEVSLDGIAWEWQKIEQIHTISLMAAASHGVNWWLNETQCLWCPVELQQAGEEQPTLPGTLLWEEQGVRVSVYRENSTVGKWYLEIENNTGWDISLETVDIFMDGVKSNPYPTFSVSHGQLGAGQRTISELALGVLEDNQAMPQEIVFRFQVRSFDETRVLFTATQSITLNTQGGE